MNDQKKRFAVFSIIVICCFSGAYFFLRKQQLSSASTEIVSETKKDSVVIVSLLSENYNFESSNDVSLSGEKFYSGKKSFRT